MITIRNIRWTDQYAFAILALQIADGRPATPCSSNHHRLSALRAGTLTRAPSKGIAMRTNERMTELDLPVIKLTLAARLMVVVNAFNTVRVALRNRLVVNRLAQLDDHLLADIGLSRAEVQHLLRSVGYADDPCAQLRRLARSRAERALRGRKPIALQLARIQLPADPGFFLHRLS
eukprot:gene65782-90007_t